MWKHMNALNLEAVPVSLFPSRMGMSEDSDGGGFSDADEAPAVTRYLNSRWRSSAATFQHPQLHTSTPGSAESAERRSPARAVAAEHSDQLQLLNALNIEARRAVMGGIRIERTVLFLQPAAQDKDSECMEEVD